MMKTSLHKRIIQVLNKSLLVLLVAGVSPALAQYASSDAAQNTTSCFPGMNNAAVLQVVVQTSGAGSVLSAIDFNTNGTTSVANIESAKLYYSNGGSFTTPLQTFEQVGSAVNTPNGSFSFTGLSVGLINGANRFFLVYDLPYNAALNDSIDAECVSLTVDGNPYTPTTTAPAGTRAIVANGTYTYCAYPATNPLNYQIGISRLEIGTTIITNAIAVAGTVQTVTSPVVDYVKDVTYGLTYRGGSGNPQAERFYLDINNDGFFEASEIIFSGSTAANAVSTGSLYADCNLEPGIHRMRIATDLGTPTSACGPNGFGTAFEVLVNIQDAAAPVASFTTPTTAYRGAYVNFPNTSQGLQYNYEWDYDNDGNVDATSINGLGQYMTVGTKTIKLTMSRTSCGTPLSNSTTRQVNIVNPTAVPTSEFIANRNVTNQTLEVRFTDLSTQGANKWHWKITPDEINGSPTYFYVNGTDSTSQNPQVLFLVLGSYHVEFWSENILGAGNYVTKPNYIRNININDVCTITSTSEEAGFLADEGGVFANYPNWATTGKLCGFKIEPSCAANISFNFLSFDMSAYQVTNCNIPGSNPPVLQPKDFVKIYDGIDNTGIPLHIGAGFPTGFSNGPANTPLPQLPPTVTATSGAMFIEYSVNCAFNGAGFLGEWSSTPKSLPTPQVSFEGPDTVYINAPYIYTNTTVGDFDETNWDYDNDGLTDFTGLDAEITFTTPGTQTVKLMAARCGNADDFTMVVTVLAPTAKPTVDFAASRTSAIVMDTLRLLDISSNGPTSWKWTINPSADIVYVNGTNSTSRNPYVRFNKTGMYEVKLWASNSLGKDSLLRSNFIGIYTYCIPNVVNQSADIGISHVSFAGIDRTSVAGSTSYTRYADIGSVQQGATYQMDIERTTNFNNANYKVWMDFNKNGSFNDAGEEVFVQSATSALTISGSIRIPRSAPIGSIRMRIGVNSESNANLSCGPNEFGEFEDYQVNISKDMTKPVITLVGDPIVYMEHGYAYNDDGATAVDNADGDLTSSIQTHTNLNINQVGEYWFSYNVTDTAGNKADSVTRHIVVQPDGSGPSITLLNGDTLYHAVNTAWTDPGATALDFVDGVISTINTQGTIDHTKLGTYYLTYSASDFQNNVNTVQRVVFVVDNIAPTLSLIGSDPMIIDFAAPFADPGVGVSDNYYTGLTYMITGMVNTKVLGTTIITYNAKDPSGNAAVSLTRSVEVKDISAPKIQLMGRDTVIIDVFDKFIEPGTLVTDNHTKGLTSSVTGTANTNILGNYTLTYTATDSSGNISTKVRVIRVVDREAPTIVLKGSSLIQMNRFDAIPDPGVILSDNYDSEGDLQTNLAILNGVITHIEGLYAYCYEVTDQSGNKSAQVCRLVNVGPADPNALTNVGNGVVAIYPNPTKGSFQINLPAGLEAESIRIYNALGALVKEVETHSGTSIAAGVNELTPGVYYVVVQADGKLYSTKLSYIR